MSLLRECVKSSLMGLGLYRTFRRSYHQLARSKHWQSFQSEINFYSHFLSAGDLCFDVGANIGAKSEIFLDLGARVVAFEPQNQCATEIRARCGQTDKLMIERCAIGREVGEMTLYVGKSTATTSLLPNWENETSVETQVPVQTLDNMIAKYGVPDFCKIDVEGFEYEVLLGLSQPLKAISLEYHLNAEDVAKVFLCIDRISSWVPISLNVSIGESPQLCWKNWTTADEFRRNFPREVPKSENCSYGDIFIRCEIK